MTSLSQTESLPQDTKRGCRNCLIVAVVLVALLLGWCHSAPFNRFPPAALDAVANDPGAVIYSLEPNSYLMDNEGKETFHGYVVLGKTTLADPADRDAMVGEITAATYGAWDRSACFDPRHGFRAVSAEGTNDFLLCFACSQAYVHLPDGGSKMVLIQGTGDFFNRYLSKHGLPLAKER